MEADDPHPAIRRIEAAVARIERAAATRAYAADSLARRHAALRTRMEEAVAVLDELIAREGKS
ncbi:hypothetical protein [Sphingomonas sp. IW22]|uniref:hypothetical protein n=1 Tax=Sphingomonas sp. IW22 TaxID=3242489 RepID=UPI003521FDF3